MSIRKWMTGTAAAVTCAASLSGCAFGDLNSMTLPGDHGVGANSYRVTVQLANALNLVPNNPVLVDDVNVGTITSVSLVGYEPTVTISLEDSVKLPANVTARVGQTSLLGALHLELVPPPSGQASGTLHNGSLIPLERTAAYPQTEDVIASVATLLNGGGLQQIKTITTELNRALGGRTATVRELLGRSVQLSTSLDAQKTAIVNALDSMNQLAAGFRANNSAINAALDTFPRALNVLNQDHKHLISTLAALGRFGDVVKTFVDTGGQPLVRNVTALAPVMRELANAKTSLTNSLWIVPTVAFPLRTMGEYIRGDYINLWGTIDVGLDTLDKGLFTGTPLAGALLNPLGFLQNPLGLTAVQGPSAYAPQLNVPGLSSSGTNAPPGAGGGSPSPKGTTSNPLGNLLGALLGGGSK